MARTPRVKSDAPKPPTVADLQIVNRQLREDIETLDERVKWADTRNSQLNAAHADFKKSSEARIEKLIEQLANAIHGANSANDRQAQAERRITFLEGVLATLSATVEAVPPLETIQGPQYPVIVGSYDNDGLPGWARK